MFIELSTHASYRELGYDISFWRTKAGAEVDFVLGRGEVAIEEKGEPRVDDQELRSLALFRETHSPRLAVVVCNEPEARVVDRIRILPWRLFFEELWNGRNMGG